MEALIAEHEKLAQAGNLQDSIDHVSYIIDLLTKTRNVIADDPDLAPQSLAKLQNPTKGAFVELNNSLKEVYKRQNNYEKAITKKFKDKPVPSTDHDALSSKPGLINRAIAMHLLREGQFEVASELNKDALLLQSEDESMDIDADPEFGGKTGLDSVKSAALHEQFANMYHILHELKENRNLVPAIAWAREKSEELEKRGSNLEFELARLQFIWIFTGSSDPSQPRPHEALRYARREFSHFQDRYMKEIIQLGGAMAYVPNLGLSPYRRLFHNEDTWEHLSKMFTREFCSLLGLSAESPLYVAATAGAIALPTMLKLQTIMEKKRTEWTTQQELPVEIPLPPTYRFHSIFVCPVSKEQTTDDNPPMMMPCGHVIAQETMSRMSKGSSFKCPYCPSESKPEAAKKLYM